MATRFTSISSILPSSSTSPAPTPRAIQPVPTSRATMTANDVSSMTTDAQGSTTEAGYFFSEWPWWWWIAAAAGGAVLLIAIVGCVCCCCCRRRKRNQAESAEEEDGAVEIHVHPPTTGLRRMNSSAAKRYLHNVVSIFSWGSDFELDKDCPIGQNEYANPQALGLSQDTVAESSLSAAPPRPPRKRKSDNIYLNIPRKG